MKKSINVVKINILYSACFFLVGGLTYHGDKLLISTSGWYWELLQVL